MQSITRTFLRGLMAILPLALSLYAAVWLAIKAESVLGGGLKKLIGDAYMTGMGVIAGFLVIFLFGILLEVWLVRTVFGWGEKILERIPLVKTIYGGMKDLLGFFGDSGRKGVNRAVMFEIAPQMRILGFITREEFDDLPDGIADEGQVAVYIPMSYQVGGYTLMVPKDRLTPVDFSVEDGMRFALTAAMSTDRPASPAELAAAASSTDAKTDDETPDAGPGRQG